MQNGVWSRITSVSPGKGANETLTQLVKDVLNEEEGLQENLQKADERFYSDMNDASASLHKAIRQSQRRFRKRILKSVFSQRVGWLRFRHSMRDYVGLILGGAMVFRGNTSPLLVSGGAVAVQSAQLGWDVLEAWHVLPHEPWLYDASAVAVAIATWKKLPGTELSKHLPLVFLALSLFQCASLVIDQWNEQNQGNAPLSYAFLATALSFIGLRVANIPIPLVAASLSGALLVYESVQAEIAGNWVYMMELVLGVAHCIAPILERLMTLVIRLFPWAWVSSHTLILERLFMWKRQVDRRRAGIRLAMEPLIRPWQEVTFSIQNHPVTRSVQQFGNRLHKAFRRIHWPFGIATWGIVVQMKYKTGMLQVLQLTIDPVSFFEKKVGIYFSEHVRKDLISFLRSVPALIRNQEKSMPPRPNRRAAPDTTSGRSPGAVRNQSGKR